MKKHTLFFIIYTFSIFLLCGCGQQTEETSPSEAQLPAVETAAGSDETKDPVTLYEEIYEETIQSAAPGNTVSENLSVIQEITSSLGMHGITAIDSENQVDMTNPQQMRDFISALESGETAGLTVLVVSAYDRFTAYDLHTEKGALEAVKTYYQYSDGAFENKSCVSFPADSWQYTEEGYFLFTGKSSSAQSLVLTMSDDTETAAWRVEPLDTQFREWNRRYLLPVGYDRNNLFLVDWHENSYENLDFYDLFNKFYPQVLNSPSPYTASKDAAVGAVYQIPEKEFESVVSLHLSIDAETLHAKTNYLEEAGAYEYRPRGFYEVEYPNLPYPEVIGGTENKDGTLTLLVNAVYPAMETSRAFTHELTVRPDAQGFQYVSNTVLPNSRDCDMGWHTDRLTEEAWEDLYGESSLLTRAEQDRLEKDALETAGLIVSVFQNNAPSEESDPARLTAKQCQEAVSLLGQAGLVSVAENIPMENPEQLEAFFAAYREHLDGQVTVFQVNDDQTLDALTFLHKNGKLQTFYTGMNFGTDGTPEKGETHIRDIAAVDLTPKGYFIYSYKETPQYASLCQYWRIRPLPETCRELTEKYMQGLSYVNYDMLVKDWTRENAETILHPALYEDLCRIHTGQEPAVKDGRIPAAQYEQIMTLYLPVTKEQVQKRCGYDAETDSYPHEVVMHRQYPPFGEVTDFEENPDGTITLTVDGVWIEHGTDCAFTNTIVVQPFADGSFRYLSNTMEQKDAKYQLTAADRP